MVVDVSLVGPGGVDVTLGSRVGVDEGGTEVDQGREGEREVGTTGPCEDTVPETWRQKKGLYGGSYRRPKGGNKGAQRECSEKFYHKDGGRHGTKVKERDVSVIGRCCISYFFGKTSTSLPLSTYVVDTLTFDYNRPISKRLRKFNLYLSDKLGYWE